MNFSLYSSAQEENIFIRKQARTWKRSGLITDDQLSAITDAIDTDLQQTNLFFRILFFIFTLLCASALVGMFVWLTIRLMFSNINIEEMFLAAILIFFGAIYYIVAEYIVSKSKFYRYGIEEGLVLIAMGLFCAGCGWLLDDYGASSKQTIIAVCALFATTAFCIYQRFGCLYTAFISLIAVCIIPFQLSLPPTNERLLLLLIFCLIFLLNFNTDKPNIDDFKKERNITIQACLLIAIYLTVNLQILGAVGLLIEDTHIIHLHPKLFPPYIYWSSYILTFVIPALGIYRGIKSRKRLIMNTSLVLACLTLSTNKSYLGMTRYAWDPAIMGIMLVGISIFITRWLKRGQDENRYGFTQRDILKPEDHGISLAEVAAALAPGAIGAQQPPAQPEKYFDGGSSGGGGASRNF
jgi:hypothetical protein